MLVFPQEDEEGIVPLTVKSTVPTGEEELQQLLQDCLSQTKLEQLTGVNDLERVCYLELSVDTTRISLGNFGQFLPSLQQLKLNNSSVRSFRDLGSSLSRLTVLWMARCSLVDLEGVNAFSALRELYLAYNHIRDISPLGFLENVEILDLEGNDISEYDQIEHLILCDSLISFTLQDNPLTMLSKTKVSTTSSTFFKNGVDDTYHDENAFPDPSYRSKVVQLLPRLHYLDDVPVTDEDRFEVIDDATETKGETMERLIDALKHDTLHFSSHNGGRSVVHDVRPHTSLALTPPVHRRENMRDPPDTRQSYDFPGETHWIPTRKLRKTSQPLPPFENKPPSDPFGEPDRTNRKVKNSTETLTPEIRPTPAPSLRIPPHKTSRPHHLEPLQRPSTAFSLGERTRPVSGPAIVPKGVRLRLHPIPPSDPPPASSVGGRRGPVNLRARASLHVPDRIRLIARPETTKFASQ